MPRKSGLPRVRFQKRITLFPGLRLNLSRSGISWTGGVRGLSVNRGKKGTYLNAGLPGTGLSTRTRIDANSPAGHPDAPQAEARSPRKPRKSAFRIIIKLIGAATIIAAVVSSLV